MTDDADVVLVGMGTLSTPVRVAIREMRKEGKKVGFVRLRWFRPFPTEELAKALSALQGRRHHRSRLLASARRTTRRRGGDGSPGRLVPGGEPAAGAGFICGLGGREVTAARRAEDDRDVLRGRGRQAAAYDAVDRRAGVRENHGDQ